jgi:hypothetical protein
MVTTVSLWARPNPRSRCPEWGRSLVQTSGYGSNELKAGKTPPGITLTTTGACRRSGALEPAVQLRKCGYASKPRRTVHHARFCREIGSQRRQGAVCRASIKSTLRTLESSGRVQYARLQSCTMRRYQNTVPNSTASILRGCRNGADSEKPKIKRAGITGSKVPRVRCRKKVLGTTT